jgi:DNA-binding transcriptional ArsR family regulator
MTATERISTLSNVTKRSACLGVGFVATNAAVARQGSMRNVIEIRLTVSDVGRMRFAYSPLAEVAESLYMLSSGRVHHVHRGWYHSVRNRLADADMALLHAVVPARSYIASFLFGGTSGPGTTFEQQLALVASMSSEQLNADLTEVWGADAMPPAARQLITAGPVGTRRLADALHKYWSIAIEPHWRSIRAILDEDVSHRARELTSDGVNAMLRDLHDQVSIDGDVLQIKKVHCSEEELVGAALLLVPSVFVWPSIIFATGTIGSPTLTYPARGVGKLWGSASEVPLDDDTLAALLGRSRAAILVTLALPHSTTELAQKLGQSPPAVSQHLAVLRRSGLVTSWRSGRSVLYKRTALAGSIVESGLLWTEAESGA